MHVIQLPRQGGKTVELLKWAWEHWSEEPILVFLDQQSADHAWDLFYDGYVKSFLDRLGDQQFKERWQNRFVSYDRFLRFQGWNRTCPVAFDNIDVLFHRQFGNPAVVTLTEEIGI